jgi:hypothetical protein
MMSQSQLSFASSNEIDPAILAPFEALPDLNWEGQRWVRVDHLQGGEEVAGVGSCCRVYLVKQSRYPCLALSDLVYSRNVGGGRTSIWLGKTISDGRSQQAARYHH